MDQFENYAGQTGYLSQLQKTFLTGEQMVHAYLFVGPAGTGRKSVVRLCIMASLCRGNSKPCGECGPCRRVMADTHPDVHTLMPEKGKKEITVGQMREFLKQSAVRSFEGGNRFFLIPEAGRMNAAAQNCLLKTLEEPPDGTVFFLIADSITALLPTIISRCRIVSFHPLDDEECVRRLLAHGLSEEDAKIRARMASGCVGQALSIDAEYLKRMQTFTEAVFGLHSREGIPRLLNQYKDEKDDREATLDMLSVAVRDILAVQAGQLPAEALRNAPQRAAYAQRVPMEGSLHLMEVIREARVRLASHVTYQTLLESIFLVLPEEYEKWPW